jgi:hypothetical protein
MDVPIPVQAFLMVFAAAASVLVILGLGAVLIRSIAVLARFFTEASYWLINGLIRGVYELSGRAANTAQRFLAARSQAQDGERATDGLPLAVRLLTSMLPGEDRENVSGDLKEEFSLFESKLDAHLWVHKQVLTSAWPFVCKTVKKKLASVFRNWVR